MSERAHEPPARTPSRFPFASTSSARRTRTRRAPPRPCARRRGSRPARGLLEARGDVDGVAGDERAPSRGAPTTTSPVLTPIRSASRRRRAPRSRRCIASASVERPLGMVLVRGRRAERRHDGVADELLDRAARAVDLGGHRVVEAVEHRARRSGSCAAASAVEPTRSAKRTVASFRSVRLRRRSATAPAGRAEACASGEGSCSSGEHAPCSEGGAPPSRLSPR